MRALLCSALCLLACSSGVDQIAPGPSSGGQAAASAGETSAGGSSSAVGGTPTIASSGKAGQASSAGAGGVSSVAGAGGGASVSGSGGAAPQAGTSSGGASPVMAGAGGESPMTEGGAGGAALGGAAGDAGAPAEDCVCDSGPCCDGCHFRPKSHFCGEVVRSSSCLGAAAPNCSTGTARIQNEYWNLFCNGDASECTRWAVHTKDVDPLCGDGLSCVGADGAAACQPCN